jgi:hypothetical protein
MERAAEQGVGVDVALVSGVPAQMTSNGFVEFPWFTQG